MIKITDVKSHLKMMHLTSVLHKPA